MLLYNEFDMSKVTDKNKKNIIEMALMDTRHAETNIDREKVQYLIDKELPAPILEEIYFGLVDGLSIEQSESMLKEIDNPYKWQVSIMRKGLENELTLEEVRPILSPSEAISPREYGRREDFVRFLSHEKYMEMQKGLSKEEKIANWLFQMELTLKLDTVVDSTLKETSYKQYKTETIEEYKKILTDKEKAVDIANKLKEGLESQDDSSDAIKKLADETVKAIMNDIKEKDALHFESKANQSTSRNFDFNKVVEQLEGEGIEYNKQSDSEKKEQKENTRTSQEHNRKTGREGR